MTTGPAARALGVHPNTLGRWYRDGLVTPATTTARGQTRWDIPDLKRQVAELSAARARAKNDEDEPPGDEELPPEEVHLTAVG